MNKYKRYIPIVAAILAAMGISLKQYGIDLDSLAGNSSSLPTIQLPAKDNKSTGQSSGHSQSGSKWSTTNPNVNLWHVFEGEINRSGKPVGYHSRPNGQDPAGARVVSVRDKPNRAGVYTATIEIQDGGQWKQKFSSFFPDSMSRDEVLDVIVSAYNNRTSGNKQPWSGPSGQGYTVQGYTSGKGGINTAFPVYVRGQ